MVREAQQELATEMEGRHITWEISPLPAVEGDPALLRQVWVNLLSNAIKFTQNREAAQIEIGSVDADDERIYFVKDNGVGFDMQYADKLLGVFQRLHRDDEFEGTGIGLWTCGKQSSSQMKRRILCPATTILRTERERGVLSSLDSSCSACY